MASWLMVLSIGPVQDFIASARRTRDLCFGSFLLSEVSKAVAKTLADGGAELIFPARSMNLNSSDSVGAPNVANIVLAHVSASSVNEVQDLVEKARKAAHDRWLDFVNQAWEKSKDLVDEKRWNAQRDRDVIEIYAAWTPLENENEYKKARYRVMELLAASKNTRCFKPWQGWTGIENSSLDGLRESVLTCGSKKGLARRSMACGDVRIKKNEALDLIGMVKRSLGDQTFPPVSRIAVDPWIRGVLKNPKTKKLLQDYCQCCEALVKLQTVSPVKAMAQYQDFPYDGAVLFIDRLDGLVDDADEKDKEAVKSQVRAMKSKLRELIKVAGEPDPYVAFLVADGDRMGAAIGHLTSAQSHRELSETLSRFAEEARVIVKEHRGMMIYAGGDDVMACVPLDQALKCSRKLHDCFGNLWKDWSHRLACTPTLSVGVSVAHCLENMADLLDFGRQAEGMAKGGLGNEDRNGLAVVVRARNNSEMILREQWKALDTGALDVMSLDERINCWIDLFGQKAMPMKLPYELRERALFYQDWPGDCSDASEGEKHQLCQAMWNDVAMILKRKELELSDSQKQEIQDLIAAGLRQSCERDGSRKRSSALKDIAAELMVSQWFLSAIQQAKGPEMGGSNHV